MENNGMEKDRQIQLVLNTPGQVEEESSIDLGRVFHNMKVRARIYAWILVLCLAVGVCAPLVMYQMKHPELTVSSVATLDYELRYSWDELLAAAETAKEREGIQQARANGDVSMLYEKVKDLTAPDLTSLDLNQVTSAYVLNNALAGLTLSQKIDVETLRRNITVTRILSQQSQRQQEVISNMVENKEKDAYSQAQNLELTYRNQFIVRLKNGFGDPDSNAKKDLKDEELRNLLNRILESYNEYLVRTYADTKLPTDEISIIDTEEMDILESLDQLETAETNLYDYCNSRTMQEKAYRSSVTGHTLENWMEALTSVLDTHIDYLNAYVLQKGIARDVESLLSNYEYQLANYNLSLEKTRADLEETQAMLKEYKNDKIFVSMQESDGSRATTDTTAYYNQLVQRQAGLYTEKRTLETNIAKMEKRITRLQNIENTDELPEVETELKGAISATYSIYQAVYDHMLEIQESTSFQNYIRYTEAYGKMDGFLAANVKNMIIGAAAGAIIAIGLWFLSALAPEFRREEKEKKEVARA